MEVFQLPIVEVIAPNGRKSFWVAAVAADKAVQAVAMILPANYAATLSRLRLTLNRKSVAFRPGDVRRVRL